MLCTLNHLPERLHILQKCSVPNFSRFWEKWVLVDSSLSEILCFETQICKNSWFCQSHISGSRNAIAIKLGQAVVVYRSRTWKNYIVRTFLDAEIWLWENHIEKLRQKSEKTWFCEFYWFLQSHIWGAINVNPMKLAQVGVQGPPSPTLQD